MLLYSIDVVKCHPDINVEEDGYCEHGLLQIDFHHQHAFMLAYYTVQRSGRLDMYTLDACDTLWSEWRQMLLSISENLHAFT